VSPGGPVFQWSQRGQRDFQCDMFHPIPILANFDLIPQQRQTLVDSNAHRENLHQTYPDYEVDDEVLVKFYNPAGLKQQAAGPFSIEQMHVNGTLLTIQQGMLNSYQ
jgi:hypothetical protein